MTLMAPVPDPKISVPLYSGGPDRTLINPNGIAADRLCGSLTFRMGDRLDGCGLGFVMQAVHLRSGLALKNRTLRLTALGV